MKIIKDFTATRHKPQPKDIIFYIYILNYLLLAKKRVKTINHMTEGMLKCSFFGATKSNILGWYCPNIIMKKKTLDDIIHYFLWQGLSLVVKYNMVCGVTPQNLMMTFMN